jgi:hypothetical protein
VRHEAPKRDRLRAAAWRRVRSANHARRGHLDPIRRAAALEFGVPECEVEVMPNGEHLMIATLREPGNPIATVFLMWAAVFLAMAGAAFVVLLKGRS